MKSNRLRFAANLSLLFNEVNLIDRFQRARDCGFEAVEIQFPYALPASVIAEKVQENHLQLVLFNVDADDLLQGGEGLAAVPEKRGRFQRALEQAASYAEVLKPEVINILPGRVLSNERRSLYWETFLENLNATLAMFSPLGIKTVFEAINTGDMPGFLISRSEQMLDVLAQVDHPMLLMQYDIYHRVKMAEPVESFIELHADKIGHIQFADVPGRGPPGSGSIDFASVFGKIRQSAYSGWLGAEYIPVNTTEQSLAWFKEMP